MIFKILGTPTVEKHRELYKLPGLKCDPVWFKMLKREYAVKEYPRKLVCVANNSKIIV